MRPARDREWPWLMTRLATRLETLGTRRPVSAARSAGTPDSGRSGRRLRPEATDAVGGVVAVAKVEWSSSFPFQAHYCGLRCGSAPDGCHLAQSLSIYAVM